MRKSCSSAIFNIWNALVADSDPDAEYEETVHKSMALRRAAEEAWRFT